NEPYAISGHARNYRHHSNGMPNQSSSTSSWNLSISYFNLRADIYTPFLIVQNMVGPGDVDDMLLAETAEECLKYGQVLECEIRETTGVPAEVAVQIFIRFQTKDQAFEGAHFTVLEPSYFLL